MSEIKSALEIALEKTQNIEGNKEKLEEHDAIQEGKQLVSKFLLEPEKKDHDIAQFIKSRDGKRRGWVRKGAFQTLLSNINLPGEEKDLEKLTPVETALGALLKDQGPISQMISQLKEFFTQYLGHKEQLLKQLEEQFAPKLREKQEALSRQIGTDVVLDPASDPEFAAALKANQSQLDGQYQQALEEFKGQLKSLFDDSWQ
jgi:hypothetical protein